jgi:hypothetical protein
VLPPQNPSNNPSRRVFSRVCIDFQEKELSITLLKKEKVSANVAFAGELPATNRLCSAETRLTAESDESMTLIIDYSHYLSWPVRRQGEPEYADFIKMKDHLSEITSITLKDPLIIKKITDLVIPAVQIRIDGDLFHQYPVKSTSLSETSEVVFAV